MAKPEPDTRARSTLAEVAEAAGVSSAAASLALRGKPGVADVTRERVEAAAAALDYRSRSSAPAGEGRNVALILKSREGEAATMNAFYGPIIAGISDEALRHELPLQLLTLAVDHRFQPIAAPDLDEDLAGAFLLGTYLTSAVAERLSDLPIVLVDGDAESGRFSSIVTDNVGGMQAITEHVIASGHRRILLAGDNDFPSIAARRDGYLAAIAASGLEPLTIAGIHDGNRELAVDAVDRVVADPTITAIVCVNDTVAVSVQHELLGRGLRVPDDLSIAGFDDIPLGAMLAPGLDTAAVDKAAMGRLAVSLLLHRFQHPNDPTHTTTLATELLVRGSVSRPRTRQ